MNALSRGSVGFLRRTKSFGPSGLLVVRTGPALAFAFVLFGGGCSRNDSATSEVGRPVKTMVVVAGENAHTRAFPGKVEASKNVELAFQVSGVLVQLPVRKGRRSPKGT